MIGDIRKQEELLMSLTKNHINVRRELPFRFLPETD
jgi:hypothetical protein